MFFYVYIGIEHVESSGKKIRANSKITNHCRNSWRK